MPAKSDNKEDSEIFSAREVLKIKQAWRRKQGQAAKKNNKRKPADYAKSEASGSRTPPDGATMARYTDILTETAQAEGSQFLSFSSFLNIGRTSEIATTRNENSQVADNEETEGPRDSERHESAEQEQGPLHRANTFEGATRARPIKDSGRAWVSRTATNLAVANLIGQTVKTANDKGQKQSKNVKSSENVPNAPCEGLARSVGSHVASSHARSSRDV